MHVEVGRLHLTLELENPDPRGRQPHHSVDTLDHAEEAYRRAQLRREVDADRERWRRESFLGTWYR